MSATASGLLAMLLGLLRNHVSERSIIGVRSLREVDALVALVARGIGGKGARWASSTSAGPPTSPES